MNIECVFVRGRAHMPLAVFIHGIGMNSSLWSKPLEARVLGGKFPVSCLVTECGDELATPFHDLRGLGFHLLSWSQSRPSGPILSSVNELRYLVREHMHYAKAGLLLICHSRGGLIARKYLEHPGATPRGLITLAAPHHGTSLARLAEYLSPATSAFGRILNSIDRREMDSALKRVIAFLNSNGLKELLPGSAFFAGLRDNKPEGCRFISIGGTNPDLFRAAGISLPDLVSGVLPEKIFPEELRTGKGDGLVSAASSVIPYGDAHRDFPVNHAAVLFTRDVRKYIIEAAEACLQ